MAQSRCPVCKEQFDYQQSRVVPFCSDRCQQLDLGRWLNEEYSIYRIQDFEEETAELE
jgi:endogenous inhibitor of DNA gyrase (YacG/DUF329 family)|tara:strand:- start:220 stop:393 length:174 start_codon:yes stop_codon:yes gene_type:complete